MDKFELSKTVIGAAFTVHNELGYGFLESVYKKALCKELRLIGLKCECEKDIEVKYKDEIVGIFRADILVENQLILELKSVLTLAPIHETQLVNYLKATGIERGLLINFGHSVEVKSKICSKK